MVAFDMTALGSSALLELELNAGLEVFKLLEPEVQKGFVALFHLFHHKQLQVNAARVLPKNAVPQPDLSSTSLNPDAPSTD
jgi:hypothetical protein